MGTGHVLSEVKHRNSVKGRCGAFSTNQAMDPTALNDLIIHCAMVQNSYSEQIMLVPECQGLEQLRILNKQVITL